MTRHATTAALALVLLVGTVVVVAGATVATTHAYFTDSETGQGSVVAADSFENTGDGACQDENQNGQCDPGEQRIDKSDLVTYTNDSADLVIPENVGDLNAGNQKVDIEAKSITSEVDIRSKTREVELTATDGGIDLGGNGVEISQGSGNVDISATGDIDLSSSTVTTNTGEVVISTDGTLNVDDSTISVDGGNGVIDLDAAAISARNTVMETNTGDISLSATRNGGGTLDATGASLAVSGGGNGGITLESVGDMYLDSASVTSSNGQATASLSQSSATIHVSGITVNDKDGVLTYSPSGVTEDPDRNDVSN